MSEKLSIQASTRAMTLSIMLTFIVAILGTGFAVNLIRPGGEMENQNRLNSDFVADILPPALFLIEPMLHATLIASDPEEVGAQEKVISGLEATYWKRLTYWQGSALTPALRQRLDERLVPIGTRFFKQLHAELVPAGRSGDAARINVAHDRLEGIYAEYKQNADQLVAEAQNESRASYASSLKVTFWTVIGLGLLGLALGGQLLGTMRMLNRRALGPLAQTASIMTRMAGGELDAGRTDDHRADEIGEMTRAIEVFRASAEDQRKSARAQQIVVEALGNALSKMADGRLDVSIEDPFADEYETLRESFNGTVVQLGYLICDVTNSASNVRDGATEILRAADDLAMRNERQAGTVEETAGAMREVTSIVAQSARATVGVRDTIAGTHGVWSPAEQRSSGWSWLWPTWKHPRRTSTKSYL